MQQRRHIIRPVNLVRVDEAIEAAPVVRNWIRAGKKEIVVKGVNGRLLHPDYFAAAIVRNAPKDYSEGRKRKIFEGRFNELTMDEALELPIAQAKALNCIGVQIDPLHIDEEATGETIDSVWDDSDNSLWVGWKYYAPQNKADERGACGEHMRRLVKAGKFTEVSATTWEDVKAGHERPLAMGLKSIACCEDAARSGTGIVEPNKTFTPLRMRIIADTKGAQRGPTFTPIPPRCPNPRCPHAEQKQMADSKLASAPAPMNVDPPANPQGGAGGGGGNDMTPPPPPPAPPVGQATRLNTRAGMNEAAGQRADLQNAMFGNPNTQQQQQQQQPPAQNQPQYQQQQPQPSNGQQQQQSLQNQTPVPMVLADSVVQQISNNIWGMLAKGTPQSFFQQQGGNVNLLPSPPPPPPTQQQQNPYYGQQQQQQHSQNVPPPPMPSPHLLNQQQTQKPPGGSLSWMDSIYNDPSLTIDQKLEYMRRVKGLQDTSTPTPATGAKGTGGGTAPMETETKKPDTPAPGGKTAAEHEAENKALEGQIKMLMAIMTKGQRITSKHDRELLRNDLAQRPKEQLAEFLAKYNERKRNSDRARDQGGRYSSRSSTTGGGGRFRDHDSDFLSDDDDMEDAEMEDEQDTRMGLANFKRKQQKQAAKGMSEAEARELVNRAFAGGSAEMFEKKRVLNEASRDAMNRRFKINRPKRQRDDDDENDNDDRSNDNDEKGGGGDEKHRDHAGMREDDGSTKAKRLTTAASKASLRVPKSGEPRKFMTPDDFGDFADGVERDVNTEIKGKFMTEEQKADIAVGALTRRLVQASLQAMTSAYPSKNSNSSSAMDTKDGSSDSAADAKVAAGASKVFNFVVRAAKRDAESDFGGGGGGGRSSGSGATAPVVTFIEYPCHPVAQEILRYHYRNDYPNETFRTFPIASGLKDILIADDLVTRG